MTDFAAMFEDIIDLRDILEWIVKPLDKPSF